MRHANPSGDLETIFGRALVLLERELEKRRLGKTTRTTKAKTSTPVPPTTAAPPAGPTRNETKSGRVSQSVRREVFARDGEQCTYLDEHGNRCPARTYLQLDHIRPKARGGRNCASNLRVRCALHNRLHAEDSFGREHVEEKIHYARAKYAAAVPPTFDMAAKGLRSMGFRELDVRRALGALAKTVDMKTAPCETVVREALRLLT